MWSWSKTVSKEQEEAWNEKIQGNPNAAIIQNKGGKTVQVVVYCDTQDDAETLKACFGGKAEEVVTTDWVAAQNREVRAPLKIRDQIIITEQIDQAFLQKLAEEYPKRHILTVPAEMAFGTGDHATTSTCLRLICDYAKAHKQDKWALTDIGCGTALLAIAGLMLGATHATAFDFDPLAIEVAQTNLIRNHVEPTSIELFTADVFTWKPTDKQKGDLVVANLFSTVLQKAFPHIVESMNPGATLIISGILASQWEETKKAGEKNGLVFERMIKKGKWVTAQAHYFA